MQSRSRERTICVQVSRASACKFDSGCAHNMRKPHQCIDSKTLLA